MIRVTARLFAAAAVLAGLAAGTQARESERSVKDWQFKGAGTQLKSGEKYTLYNVTEKQSLKYGERKWGINLVWDKSQSPGNVRVVTRGIANGPIRYGDKVALQVDKGGYLKYEKRDYGINLVWSKAPVYEFVITGGAKGQPVAVNAPVGIYNEVEKDFVIRAERPVGVGLRWYKDRDKGGLAAVLKDAAKDLVKDGLKELADDFLGKK